MPTQPLAVGVTMTVATIELVPVFTAVKLGKEDVVPDAARPIAGVLFVQLKVVPVTLLLKFNTGLIDPLHTL